MSKSRRKRKARQRTVRLTPDQVQEFLRVVHDDLAFLRSQNRQRPSRTDVRFASSVLRRLLHEGTYRAAWTLSGIEGEPFFDAVDLPAVVAELSRRYIQYAYAGGAHTAGAQHCGYVLLLVPRAEAEKEGAEAIAQRLRGLIKPGVRRAFSLPEFCASPCVLSGAAAVSRVEVLRYVANKLGGVHWDSERGAWTDPVGSRHRLLDENHINVGLLSAPLYEVISIAEAVATAESTARLLERISAVAPEEDRLANVLSFREGRVGKYADMTFGPKKEEPQSTPNKVSEA